MASGFILNLLECINEGDGNCFFNCLGYLIILIAFFIFNSNKIDPIEVYKGNTELEYKAKYVNGEFIKTDSTVVLKKCKQ